jgi:hypothetical protein
MKKAADKKLSLLAKSINVSKTEKPLPVQNRSKSEKLPVKIPSDGRPRSRARVIWQESGVGGNRFWSRAPNFVARVSRLGRFPESSPSDRVCSISSGFFRTVTDRFLESDLRIRQFLFSTGFVDEFSTLNVTEILSDS